MQDFPLKKKRQGSGGWEAGFREESDSQVQGPWGSEEDKAGQSGKGAAHGVEGAATVSSLFCLRRSNRGPRSWEGDRQSL